MGKREFSGFNGGSIVIQLENNVNFGLVAGTTISGVVQVNLTKPFPAHTLQMILYGEEKTQFDVAVGKSVQTYESWRELGKNVITVAIWPGGKGAP